MAAPRNRRSNRRRSPSEWVEWAADEAIEITFSLAVAAIVIWFLVSCAWGVISGGS